MLFGDQEYEDAVAIGMQWHERMLNAPVYNDQYDLQHRARFHFVKKLKAVGLAAGAASTFLRYMTSNPDKGKQYLRDVQASSNEDMQIGRLFAEATSSQATPDTAKRPSLANPPRRGKTVKNNQAMRNWQDEAEAMDVEPTAAPSATAAKSSNNSSTKNEQTQITRMPPRFGFPNTATQILTSTTYFSVITSENPDLMMACRFQVRLTGINDSIITNRTFPSASQSFTTGIYALPHPFNTANTAWPAVLTANTFPNSSPDEMFTRVWFGKMYRYYAVLGVEYTLECNNMRNTAERDVVVARWIDTFSDAAATVHPTAGATTMTDMQQWKDIKWDVVPSMEQSGGNGRSRTIRGYYKPGMVKQNVENDDDVDTWTQVGQNPKLSEHLTFAFGKHWNSVGASAQSGNNLLNCRLNMRYIVQFKDLIPELEWPSSGQSDVTFFAPGDLLQA